MERMAKSMSRASVVLKTGFNAPPMQMTTAVTETPKDEAQLLIDEMEELLRPVD